LIIGFLSLGLFVPQVEYQSSVIIDDSIAEVFQSYNDIESISNWIPEIKSVKALKLTEEKEGSVYEMVIDSDGTEVKMEETVLAYEVNKLVSLKFETGPMDKIDEFQFLEEGNKTKIVAKHRVEGTNYFYKCMFAMFKGGLSTVDQGYLEKFKEYQEQK